MSVFETIVIIEIFVGFTLQAFLLIFMSFLNKRYYTALLELTSVQTARATLLLLGKLDETTDASVVTLNETARTGKKVTEMVSDIKQQIANKDTSLT